MSKRPISFRISRSLFNMIRDEANQRNLTLSAVIEERLDPYAEFRKGKAST